MVHGVKVRPRLLRLPWTSVCECRVQFPVEGVPRVWGDEDVTTLPHRETCECGTTLSARTAGMLDQLVKTHQTNCAKGATK